VGQCARAAVAAYQATAPAATANQPPALVGAEPSAKLATQSSSATKNSP
jgi:hypothetical protein